ncbi:amino acid transporter [Haloplanus aerogenes]|uniref:Amino acid transporter n=1 Tax=Haloplanus aerogenes TaxID=660522 RepID=A0A3M0CYT8_9EURY|nr:amino acid transporter [Haloplanus aerogenes]
MNVSLDRPLGVRHVVAVALGLPLGAGVFALPHGVENLGGPATPVAYVVGTLAVCSVAVAYAVYLSSPLAECDGLVYAAVSRTWGSRRLGFLAAWPAVGAYVAVLAALVAALGRSLAGVVPLSPTVSTFVVLAVLVAIHALGPDVAGRAQLYVVGPLVALLVVMALAALLAVAPDNFSPLFPTPTLREQPLAALGAATAATLFGFVGFDAGAAVSTVTRDPRRTVPRALLLAVVLAGAVAVAAAFVTLGVIPWPRLVFAAAPFADAAASGLGVETTLLLGPGMLLATLGAALATVWLPTRAIRGFAEVIPGADRDTRPGLPDPALALTGLLAGAVVALDAVGQALYLSLAGIFVGYGTVAASVAVLPVLRPTLYRRCRLRLPAPALATVALVGVATAAVVLWQVFALDPATSLGFTRWDPALAVVDEAVLVRDPLSTVLPALLLWELVGVAVLAVAADYRADRGVERPPLSAAYEGRE